MHYWTVLWLTYTLATGEEIKSSILLPNEQACTDAIEQVYDAVSVSYKDTMAQCVVSDILSKTTRPMARPKEMQ